MTISQIISVLSFPGRKVFVLWLLAAITCALFPANEVNAQGNLLITPRRAVFEGTVRTIDLNLANTGSDTATYAISLVQIRMTDDGGFETITAPDPGQRFADRFIRYFPRTVTLGPNEAQVVKVQLSGANMEPGEYRSHFYFRALPDTRPLGDPDPVRDSTEISVVLTPVFGITIPVIIRAGTPDVETVITDLAFEMTGDGVPTINMVLRRSGNMSVYGDIVVDHISAAGIITRLGAANGLAVYTPNSFRRVKMSLSAVPGVDFSSGSLRVTYSASSDMKPQQYAVAELKLR